MNFVTVSVIQIPAFRLNLILYICILIPFTSLNIVYFNLIKHENCKAANICPHQDNVFQSGSHCTRWEFLVNVM